VVEIEGEPPLPAPRSAARAALLSFLWPGLGQEYRGERRRAAVQAAPQLVVVLLFVLAVLVLHPVIVVAYLFNPLVSLGLLVVVVLLALWHAWSITDAIGWPRLWLRSARAGSSAPTRLWATALIVLVLLIHSWVGYNLLAFYRVGTVIYQPPDISVLPSPTPGATQPDGSPMASGETAPPSTLAPGETPGPGSTPLPPLPGSNDRVTILLVGMDNTHGDLLALTDTLIVASFDPQQGSLAMISLPRDTAHLPYYRGGTFLPRINSLRQQAVRSPAEFPDGPMGTLVNEMSYIVGIPIDYYALIGIAGFSQLIDAVGGVDIDVPRTVDDPGYGFSPTEVGFHVDPGWHHFDGKYGTAYARSRHGSSDYARAARQQQLLLALRSKLSDPFVLTNLPQILDAVSQIVRTDAPLDRLPDIISIVERSTFADTRNIVLDPPQYASGVRTSTGDPTNMNQLNMDAVAQLSIELFGADSLYSH
jgi:LCP family protein required for cell wall assembly